MRIVVADDSGLRHLLPSHGVEIAGTAADADELLEAVERTRPDVALVDIRMPPTYTIEGIAAAAAIQQRTPEVGVLVLSQHVEADYALELLRHSPAGCGYLLKERITEVSTLVEAIHRIGCGESVLDRELVALLLNRPAQRLWVTPKTVETHVRHILAKLSLPADSQHNRRVLAVLTYLRDGHREQRDR